MAGEPAAAPSRIFGQSQGQEPRTQAQVGDQNGEGSPNTVERDPITGRWLKPGFTTALVGRAKRLGINDADLREMSSDDLRAEVRDREDSARWDKVLNVKDTMDRVKEQNRQAIANTPQPKFELGVTEEELNPAAISAMQRIVDRYEEKIAKLEERLGTTENVTRSQQQRENQSFERRIEKQFSKHPELFGTGTAQELRERNSPQFHLRMAAVAAHAEAGGLPEDLDENIEQFIAQTLGKGGRQAPAGDEGGTPDPLAEIAQWQQGVLNRPTQAGPRTAPEGREKAVQGVQQSLAGHRPSKPTRGQYLRHGPNPAGQNGQG